MRRFLIILRKELKDMLTWQTIFPIILVMVIYGVLGRVINTEQKKQAAPQPIAVVDFDRTTTSQTLTGIIGKANFEVTTYTGGTVEEIVQKVAAAKGRAVVVIPKGFETGLMAREPQQVETYTILRSFSLMSMTSFVQLDAVVTAMNRFIGDQYIAMGMPGTDPSIVRNAVSAKSYVTVGGVTAAGNPQEIAGMVTQQTMVIPIVLTLVIIMAAQMIASSIAGEKENKTLETLLSTPIGRGSLVTAKMMSSGLVALVSAGAYMVGMKSYMGGIMASEAASPGAVEAVQKLGLVLDVRGYVLLGLSVFAGIMVALAIAVILGAFSEDIKNVQVMITPLMMMVLLPYLMTMFVDVNSASPFLRWLLYAIPFSHPLLAPQYIYAHNFMPVVAGIVYQGLLFGVFATIAARIFSTDRILTMRLNTAARRGLGGWTLRREGFNIRIRRK